MGPATKRRRADDSARSKRQQLSISTPSSRGPQQPGLLLELPPDLRNLIWELAISDSPAIRLPTKYKACRLAIRTPLLLVNKQVRDEVEGVAAFTAPLIETTVFNFDFRHVVAHLNRMSDLDLKRFSTADKAAPMQIFQVNLEFRSHRNADGALLERWVRRASRPEKKSTQIRFSYKSTTLVPELHFPETLPIHRFFRYISSCHGCDDGRGRQEISAIWAALVQGATLDGERPSWSVSFRFDEMCIERGQVG